MFDPENPDHLYVARHWPGGGVFRIELVSDRSNFDPDDCIVQVDEVIKGRYTGAQAPSGLTSNNHASEIINLLITATHVYAGVTSGHLDKAGDNHTGGLIWWDKMSSANPDENNWIIGGVDSNPNDETSRTIAIGGMAQDPSHPETVYAVTYRFTLRGANGAKLRGEDNYKLMNLWQITNDNGELDIIRLSNSTTQHQWPDAVTMAFFPNNPDKIIMPTHGNGIWLGTRSGAGKILAQRDSTFEKGNMPERFALYENFPNPFNSATAIRFDLPEAAEVKIVIYDALGRQVRILLDSHEEAGSHNLVWDGKNDDNQPVTSGLYFYRFHSPRFTKTRKMLFLH